MASAILSNLSKKMMGISKNHIQFYTLYTKFGVLLSHFGLFTPEMRLSWDKDTMSKTISLETAMAKLGISSLRR